MLLLRLDDLDIKIAYKEKKKLQRLHHRAWLPYLPIPWVWRSSY